METAPGPEIVAALQNIAALIGQARQQGGKLDTATLESLRSMAGQVLDAVNADPTLPADDLVNVSDLIAAIADIVEPAPFDAVEDPGEPGRPAPAGNTVSMAMSGEIVGKSQCLGEIVESYTGPLATPWGRPAQVTGVDFARTLARQSTGKRDRQR